MVRGELEGVEGVKREAPFVAGAGPKSQTVQPIRCQGGCGGLGGEEAAATFGTAVKGLTALEHLPHEQSCVVGLEFTMSWVVVKRVG